MCMSSAQLRCESPNALAMRSLMSALAKRANEQLASRNSRVTFTPRYGRCCVPQSPRKLEKNSERSGRADARGQAQNGEERRGEFVKQFLFRFVARCSSHGPLFRVNNSPWLWRTAARKQRKEYFGGSARGEGRTSAANNLRRVVLKF